MFERIKNFSFKTWLIVAVTSVFLIAGGFLGYTYLSGKWSKGDSPEFSLVDKHKDKEDGQSKETKDIEKKKEEDKGYLKEKLDGLSSTNKDTIGFIYIPGTRLEEPVVQGTDNETYLNKTFEGGNVPFLGAVYLDAYNSKYFTDRLTWMFGHARGSRVGDHRMFNDVNYYASQSFMDSHRYVVVETTHKKLYYEVAFMTIVPEDTALYRRDFADDGDYFEHLEKVHKQASTVNNNVILRAGDKYLVLSTCREEDDTLRANLYCRLIPDSELGAVLDSVGDSLEYRRTR